MAFAGGSAPPASAKQLDYLLALVRKAGHDGFRDARHPLGLTQRQAAGKFSRTEASELIEQLAGGADDESSSSSSAAGAAGGGDPNGLDGVPTSARWWRSSAAGASRSRRRRPAEPPAALAHNAQLSSSCCALHHRMVHGAAVEETGMTPVRGAGRGL